MGKTRDPFFDVVKALAIFLVLFGHVSGLAAGDMFPTWLGNFRVGMNMPIFFIISGYFAWPTIGHCDWGKLVRSVRSYFQPALLAGLVFMPIELAFGIASPSIKDVTVRMLRFVFVGPWFISVLAACYVLLFVSFAIGRRYKIVGGGGDCICGMATGCVSAFRIAWHDVVWLFCEHVSSFRVWRDSVEKIGMPSLGILAMWGILLRGFYGVCIFGRYRWN